MSKTVKKFNKLPEESIIIRKLVFVEEQGFKNEFDEVDSIAEHIVIYEHNNLNIEPIATCRFYKDNDNKYLIGRIAVIKEKRGENIGALLIEAAEKEIKKSGGRQLKIHAQYRVKGFYEKQGYIASGNIDEDEGIPHIWMYKDIT